MYTYGFINNYLHVGPGATEEDVYQFSSEAATFRAQECSDAKVLRDINLVNRAMALTFNNISAFNSSLVSFRDIFQESLYTPAVCLQHGPTGAPPLVVMFLGTYISSWFMWRVLIVCAFIGTIVSAYASNTAGIYISNVIQDSDVIDIPYSECTIQLSRAVLTAYWCVSSVFELQISFAQVDFLVVVIIGQVLYGIAATRTFMEEKNRKRAERTAAKRLKMYMLQQQQQQQQQQHSSSHGSGNSVPPRSVHSIQYSFGKQMKKRQRGPLFGTRH
jgi:hypothetical protein